MRFSCFALSLALCATVAGAPIEVRVTNDSEFSFENVPIVMPWDGRTGELPRSILPSGKPVQVDDTDGNGRPDELVFFVSIGPKNETTMRLCGDAPKDPVTSAAHTGMYLKTPERKGFEGPGWESDRIAFRLYWDARNASDVFAKTAPIMSLDAYASNGLDYHVQSKWGQDVLKVGQAVGIGAPAIWLDGKVEKVTTATRTFKVVADGPLRAICDLIYTDWTVGDRKFDLTCRMSIMAGQEWAQADLSLVPKDRLGLLPEFVAGFVKHEDTTLVESLQAGYAGRWGKQALGDKEVPKSNTLGLAVIADPESIAGFAEDKVNTFFRLKADNGKCTYRYTAEWEKTPGAAKSAEEYKKTLEKQSALRQVRATLVKGEEE